MAHKHNRRRVRSRQRQAAPQMPSYLATSAFPSPLLPLTGSSFIKPQSQPPLFDPWNRVVPISTSLANSFSSASSRSSPSLKSTPRYSSVLAQHWQNRYMAWQNKDKAQKEEIAKIEADRLRLFGGEPGDDAGLCYKMLEFFGGLDYIDE